MGQKIFLLFFVLGERRIDMQVKKIDDYTTFKQLKGIKFIGDYKNKNLYQERNIARIKSSIKNNKFFQDIFTKKDGYILINKSVESFAAYAHKFHTSLSLYFDDAQKGLLSKFKGLFAAPLMYNLIDISDNTSVYDKGDELNEEIESRFNSAIRNYTEEDYDNLMDSIQEAKWNNKPPKPHTLESMDYHTKQYIANLPNNDVHDAAMKHFASLVYGQFIRGHEKYKPHQELINFIKDSNKTCYEIKSKEKALEILQSLNTYRLAKGYLLSTNPENSVLPLLSYYIEKAFSTPEEWKTNRLKYPQYEDIVYDEDTVRNDFKIHVHQLVRMAYGEDTVLYKDNYDYNEYVYKLRNTFAKLKQLYKAKKWDEFDLLATKTRQEICVHGISNTIEGQAAFAELMEDMQVCSQYDNDEIRFDFIEEKFDKIFKIDKKDSNDKFNQSTYKIILDNILNWDNPGQRVKTDG